MLNIITAIIFTFLSLVIFQLIGEMLIKILGLNYMNKSFNFVYGFFFVAFVNFLIAVPVQIFHLSWNIYVTLFSLVLLLLIVTSTIFHGKFIFNKEKLFQHFKKYWFVYFVIIAHLVVNTASNLNMYLNAQNDDSYYLSRIVKNINNEHIMSSIPVFDSRVINAPDSLLRQLETFELLWSYIASFLPTDVITTVRFVFSPLILAIIYGSYYLLIDSFWGNKKRNAIQYSMFFVFLISLTGMVYIPTVVQPFFSLMDNWKFSTTLYYGSTIVMMCAAPLAVHTFYSYLIRAYRPVLFYIVTCCIGLSLLSFGPQVIPVFAAIYFFLSLVLAFNEKHKAKLKIYISTCILILILGAIFGKLLVTSEVVIDVRINILYYFVCVFLIFLYFTYLRKQNSIIESFHISLFLLLVTMLIFPVQNFLVYLGGVPFVYYRTISSLLIFAVIYSGAFFIYNFGKYTKAKFIKNNVNKFIVGSFCLLLIIISVFYRSPKVQNILQTGYGMSSRAFFNLSKIHPIIEKTNERILDYHELSSNTEDIKFISPFHVRLNGKLLMFESIQQSILPENMIDYGSLIRAEQFISDESLLDDKLKNITYLIAYEPETLTIDDMQYLKNTYEIQYLIIQDNGLEDKLDIKIIGRISDDELTDELIIYLIE